MQPTSKSNTRTTICRHDDHHGSGGAATDYDAGILLSGCQTNELSSDLAGDGSKQACGAFSSSLQDVLAAHPAPMSNREVVCRAREVLAERGFDDQHPCLYCSDANADAPFLGQHESKAKHSN